MFDRDLLQHPSLHNVKGNRAFLRYYPAVLQWLTMMYEAIEIVDPQSWAKVLPLSTKIARKRVPTWAVAYDWTGPQTTRLLCADKNFPPKDLLRSGVEKSCRDMLKEHAIYQKEIISLMPIWLVNEPGGYLEHARRVLDKGKSKFVKRPAVPAEDLGAGRVQLWLHLELKNDGRAKEDAFPIAEFLYPDRHGGDVQSAAESEIPTGSTGIGASLTSARPSSRASDLLTSDLRTQTDQGSSVLSQAFGRSSDSLRTSSMFTSVLSSATSNSKPHRPVIRNSELDSILEKTADEIRKGNGQYAHTR